MVDKSPIRQTDDAARDLARALMANATFGALGVIDPQTGAPFVSRIAIALDPEGLPLTLVSDLSPHTAGLRAAPRASLLLGEPGPKGDPLTHPRITLDILATFVGPNTSGYEELREHWVVERPKSKLYVDFADFHLVRLRPQSAALNAGFGKAFALTAKDLRP